MDGGRAMRRLERHQTDIAALLHHAVEIFEASATDDHSAIASLRWRLMRALREYQLFKHHEIFDPLATSLDARVSSTAELMKKRCIAVGDAYAAHVRRWSDGTATTASASYLTEARDIVGAIGRHLERERREAETLLGNIVRTRHPGGVGSVASNSSSRTE